VRSPPPRNRPKLTGLRRAKPGTVLLEVDGRPWRTVPDAVVVSCGLAAGTELDRPLLRRVRTELRQAQAFAAAGRVLRRRDVSRRGLEDRLARAGVGPEAGERAVTALVDAGAVDDRRLAERRGQALAKRGWGDEAIRARLAGEGLGAEAIVAALGRLEPERDRAIRVAATAGDARKAWNLLSRRGFDADVVSETVAALDEEAAGGLG
jgi:SOS response regulatory protein OraA/RecX